MQAKQQTTAVRMDKLLGAGDDGGRVDEASHGDGGAGLDETEGGERGRGEWGLGFAQVVDGVALIHPRARGMADACGISAPANAAMTRRREEEDDLQMGWAMHCAHRAQSNRRSRRSSHLLLHLQSAAAANHPISATGVSSLLSSSWWTPVNSSIPSTAPSSSPSRILSGLTRLQLRPAPVTGHAARGGGGARPLRPCLLSSAWTSSPAAASSSPPSGREPAVAYSPPHQGLLTALGCTSSVRQVQIPYDHDPHPWSFPHLQQLLDPSKMGDPSVEVTEGNRDASQEVKCLAVEAMSQGKLEEAVEHLTKAILLNPTLAIMYGTRDGSPFAQGDRGEP